MRVSLALSSHLVQYHPKIVMRFGEPRRCLDGRLEVLSGALPLALVVRFNPLIIVLGSGRRLRVNLNSTVIAHMGSGGCGAVARLIDGFFISRKNQ